MSNRRHSPIGRRAFLGASAASVAAGCGFTATDTGSPGRVASSPLGRPPGRTIVLGIDGMDPGLVRTFLAQGKLPHIARLIQTGSMTSLKTSNPPQSPVAWSNFISGTDPGGHGLFDFVHRDPQSMTLFHSIARQDGTGLEYRVGDWRIPLESRPVRNLRHGPCFWNLLEQHGVPCTIFKVPANFPPTSTSARTLSGMGTPDLRGTYGTFTWFAESLPGGSRDVSGGRLERVDSQADTFICRLLGPVDEFTTSGASLIAELQVARDPLARAARVTIDGSPVLLREGEWSDWRVVRFTPTALGGSVTGICRLYLKSVAPFGLYVSPVNINPDDPAVPISTPPDYARTLVSELGYFYTQGIVEDTSALTSGILSSEEYCQQARFVHEERFRFFEHELGRFRKGFLFYYFSTLDLSSHMFWRAIDRQHPAYSLELNRQFGGLIESLYQKIDDAVGRAQAALSPGDWLLVLSDHGFCSFRRQFNLNSWLLKQGLLRTRGAPDRAASHFQGVNWDQTRAYGVGLNSLFLNRSGRERQGPVDADEGDRLLTEIADQLLKEVDPDNGERVVSSVARGRDIYHGPYRDEAPDLIVGYRPGYRASWDTVLGGFPREILQDNDREWSGDHCVDPAAVPGILISSLPLPRRAPALEDVAPGILAAYEMATPPEMTGQSLFRANSPTG
jgi:predicted AlkP superfamily phosphohydrolase/phosphomutase